MYTIAGVNYYQLTDSDSTIIKAYYQHVVSDESKEQVQFIFGGESAYIQFTTARVREALAHGGRGTVVYMINTAIASKEIEQYENHWIKFLGNNGLRFDASLVRLNTVDLVTAMRLSNDPFPTSAEEALMNYNDVRYLAFNTFSTLTDDKGNHLGITYELMRTLVDTFRGSYVDIESNPNNPRICIQYFPSYDTSVALTLNNYLHMYL